jgi:hypothetical protein
VEIDGGTSSFSTPPFEHVFDATRVRVDRPSAPTEADHLLHHRLEAARSELGGRRVAVHAAEQAQDEFVDPDLAGRRAARLAVMGLRMAPERED